MNTLSSHLPDDELQAGYALADLSAEELSLWQSRAAEEGLTPDASLEWIVLQLEINAAMKESGEIPPFLAAMLKQQIPQASVTSPAKLESTKEEESPVIVGSFGSSILPWIGWAVAACLALLFVVQMKKPAATATVDVEKSPATLEQQAKDLTRLKMTGTPGVYEGASGEVLWSNELQQGYLLLSDLPVNDPEKAQYQLWIVDPKRDEIPVDGGVFDIVADASGKAQIEIQAKLNVRDPQAFVITLEQPGGVVRSKQETVVAIAKL